MLQCDLLVNADNKLKLQHSVWVDNPLNVGLDRPKLHEPTRLAFQVVDGCRERGEVTAAAGVRTVVERLLVDRRIEVLVQAIQRVEKPGA